MSLPGVSGDVLEAGFAGSGGSEVLEGRYNVGYVVDGVDFDVGGEVVEDPDGFVLWAPLEGSTPEMESQSDLMSYHLARQRNADVLRGEGLDVPDTDIVLGGFGGGFASFLVTPYVEHDCFDQRPKFLGGDSRRNNPHKPDPYRSPARESFESEIDRALSDVDGEWLVDSGRLVNAGSGDIDGHNKNWGLVDDELVRLDIGEVPANGEVWSDMPYGGPEEFYREEGIREDAREVLYDLGVDPDAGIPEGYRELMD